MIINISIFPLIMFTGETEQSQYRRWHLLYLPQTK